MNWRAVAGVAAMFVLLAYGTVVVFLLFNRDANSVSDVVRPFVLTMAPVWIVAIVAARVVLRRS